jgi:integrase
LHLSNTWASGRLEYRRAKTGRLYSIKVEPEAMAIIEKYRGRRHLLFFMDNYSSARDYLGHVNRGLKAIGRIEGKQGKVLEPGPFNEISTYWARHSWATLAYEIGIPVDVIGQALGHSDRSHTVTFIYIRPDQGKVDEANRRVIDALISDECLKI